MSKSIASKRMESTRVHPRIMLLRSIAQDDMPDIATKIDVEEHSQKILE